MQELTIEEVAQVSGGSVAGSVAMTLATGWAGL